MQPSGCRARWLRTTPALFFVALLPACSSDNSFSTETTADLAGTYTIALTNGHNDCPFLTDWMQGESSSGHQLTIVQSGTSLMANAEGAAGLALWAVTGTAAFSGAVEGFHFTLTAFGTKEYTQEACIFTLNANVQGDSSGDSISGDIRYSPVAKTAGSDCEAVACEAQQAFNGTRPP